MVEKYLQYPERQNIESGIREYGNEDAAINYYEKRFLLFA